MKQFNNYAQARESANFKGAEKLPKGGYVAKILDVKFNNGTKGNSDYIVISYDITEGEHKDFFKEQYEKDTREDKKWKGRTTIYCPKEDGSEKDQWTMNAFAKWTRAFEESNSGYSWDWDEQKWKGLSVGLIYGEVGANIDGRNCTFTECRFPATVEEIRTNDYKVPDFKARKDYNESATPASDSNFMEIPESVAEGVPFN